MFAVLEFSEPERKNRNIFHRAKIESQRITLPTGEVFFIVRAEKHRGKIPWKKIERCLGFLRDGVVLPEGITVPEGVGIKAFTPERLPLLMLFNSAVKHIKKERKTYGRLCVVDEKGLFIPFAEKLILNFGEIKIITPCKDEYEGLSLLLLQKYGASLLITDKGKADGDVVISPRGEEVDITFSGVFYTLKNRRLLSGRVLCPKGQILPPLCDEMCPLGVDSLTFASALYEKCGVKELEKAEYETFC